MFQQIAMCVLYSISDVHLFPSTVTFRSTGDADIVFSILQSIKEQKI